MINAIVEIRDKTLILEFPSGNYDLQKELLSVGIDKPPHKIPLTDEDGDDVRVKLYAGSEVGRHLLLTLTGQNTLADANQLSFAVCNTSEDILSELEPEILSDHFDSMQNVLGYIRQKTYGTGPVKVKNLAGLKRILKPGTEFVATYHSKHPGIVGLVRVVTEVHTNGFYSKIKDQPDHWYSTCNQGKGFYTGFQKAGFYRFDGPTIQVLDPCSSDESILFEMEVYDSEIRMDMDKSGPVMEM